MYGSAHDVGTHKDATICGSMVTYAKSVQSTNIPQNAEGVKR